MVSALHAGSCVELIRQTTRLSLEQTRDLGALMAALLSDPSVARLMEADGRAERQGRLRFFVRATRREYDLPFQLAIASVERLSALTDRAGKLVGQTQPEVETATAVCVELITGGLGALKADRPITD